MANPSAVPPAARMFSAGSVSFKGYLQQNGSDKPKEVRRFGMEQNEVTSFDMFKTKLRQVFPSLGRQEFTVHWKDFEQDDIIISSDEELLTALTETADEPVRRIYIFLKTSISVNIQPSFEFKPFGGLIADAIVDVADGAGNDSDEDDEERLPTTPGCKRSWHSGLRSTPPKYHHNVICDGCNNNVPSHRYKCLECPDYDLCFDCESKKMHSEHVMMRVPLTKSNYFNYNQFHKSMHHMSDAMRKVESRCKKQERRMNKIVEGNLNKHYDELLDLGEDVFHLIKRCKRDSKDSKKDRKEKKEHAASTSTSTTAAAASSAESSSRANAGESSARANTAPSDKQKTSNEQSSKRGCPFPATGLLSFLNPETIGNFINPQNLNTLQHFLEQITPVPEQLLQDVAQSLADVRLSDPSSSAAPPTAPPAANPFAANSQKATRSAEGNISDPSTSNATPVDSDKSEKQFKSPAIAQALAASAQTEVSASPSASAPAAQSDPDVIVEQSGRSSRSSSEEADTEGWTVVNSKVKENVPDQARVYPKLPVVEPTPEPQVPQAASVNQAELISHKDPDVQKCLRALAEMGYDAHERAIIDLAEEYKGNLSRVLNFLLA